MEHEEAYLARYAPPGATSARSCSRTASRSDWDARGAATEQAIRDGVDVVYQARLRRRRAGAGSPTSSSGSRDGSYEAVDTKLARHAKPSYILQLCFYSEQLGRIQGREPEQIHVCSGSGERAVVPARGVRRVLPARPRAARAVRRRAAGRPSRGRSTTAASATSSRSATSTGTRSTTSRASPASGASQIEKLMPPGSRRSPRSAAPRPSRRRGLSPETYAKLRQQAELQLQRRETGATVYELLAAAPERGFALLPEPSPGDLFFDFEGNPFWDERRRASSTSGASSTPTGEFTPLGATTATSERRAFEQFVDLVHERLAEHPDMHVYHYAAYELTALKRLPGRYGTREDGDRRPAAPRRLRRPAQASSATAPRLACPATGSRSWRRSSTSSARPSQGRRHVDRRLRALACRRGDRRSSAQIDAYNEEDCIATLLLRDWLLELRGRGARALRAVPAARAARAEGAEPEKRSSARRCARRCSTPGEERGRRSCSTTTAARRKPVWWAFFDRLEHDAGGAGRGRRVDRPRSSPSASRSRSQALAGRTRSRSRRRSTSSSAATTSVDPATGKPRGRARSRSTARRATLELKRGPKLDDVPLPRALIPGGPYGRRAGGRARAVRPLAPRRRRPLPGARVDPRAASRSTATCRRPTSRR